jgi:hypothetical protein
MHDSQLLQRHHIAEVEVLQPALQSFVRQVAVSSIHKASAPSFNHISTKVCYMCVIVVGSVNASHLMPCHGHRN